ncbi:MAG: DUF342 domain-containing protein [Planctomycetota bacterium]|nr:MAG: DUF342 domain-containing protein [Planctomycetota bacterium]
MADEPLQGAVVVEVADDAMSAVMRFEPDPDGVEITSDICQGAAQEAGLSLTPELQQRIHDFLAALRLQGGKPFEAVVAAGTPPQHGEDGWIEFYPGFDPRPKKKRAADLDAAETNDSDERRDEQAPAEATDGQADDEPVRVDHHERSAFLLVRQGDVLGQVHRPTEGVPGETVRGKTIAARTGKPALLALDESIQLSEENELIAQVDGVLHFDGKRLRVLTELVIDEYVDFNTGNVDFPGDVKVRKGVRDCFKVHADGELRVEGLVEAAHVSADGDMHLLGGMAARHKGSVRVGRDLHARYLDGVTAHVGRNLRVDKEVNDCTIDVVGAIESPNAAIVGGAVYACRGAEVAILGQDDARTFIAVGQSKELSDIAEDAERVLEKVHDVLKPAQREYDILMKNLSKLTAQQAERLTELQFEISTRRDQAKRINDGLESLNQIAAEYVRPQLTVQKRLYAGTQVRLGKFIAKFKEDLKGPVRLEAPVGKRPTITDLITGSTSDLSEYASVWKAGEEEAASAAA